MTKTEIIEAAFRVWGREFYLDTSLSKLAQELGVSKPALYRHFKDKKALLDAMTAHFFDRFTAFILPEYEKNRQNKTDNLMRCLIRPITEFLARNVYAFIFSLVNIYDWKTGGGGLIERLKIDGLDTSGFHGGIKTKTQRLLVRRMTFATLTLLLSHFHKTGKSFNKTPSEAKIKQIIEMVDTIVSNGLGYSVDDVDALDYAKLEDRIGQTTGSIEDDPLLKAVAEAVAAAGPWEASMDMVARRSGLAKSSLYGHFKNKQDMLRQLFLTEFTRINEFARQGIKLSTVPEEQLYLGIFSLAVYLRSKPEILITMDWIRTRKLDLGKPAQKPEVFKAFEEIQMHRGQTDFGRLHKQIIPHWIFFLIICILMQRSEGQPLRKWANKDIRTLYRFLTLGINGFHTGSPENRDVKNKNKNLKKLVK